MPALPLASYGREGIARWSIEGDSFTIEFDNLTVGGLYLVDSDNDSFPDAVNWSKPWTGLRNCSEFFDADTLVALGNISSSCEWIANSSLHNHTNVLEVRLSDPQVVSVGDNITVGKYVVYGYYSNLSSWAFAPLSNYSLQAPQPLFSPAVELYADSGVKLAHSSNYDVAICKGLRVDVFLADRNHGSMPSYTWSVLGASCSYTSDIDGKTSDYSPTSSGLTKLQALVEGSSAGSNPFTTGAASLSLSNADLESGCTYSLSLQLRSRWGLSTTQSFTLAKQGPSLLHWMPTCEYYCNAATCEPPSQCVDGKCVCATDRWGPICRGECSCSPYTTTGCNQTTGKCICVSGKYGDDCSQNVEWKDLGWGACFPCGSAIASQSAIFKCVLSDTAVETIVDDSHCSAKLDTLTRTCTAPLCPCLVMPTLPGLNPTSLQHCSNTISGGRCTAYCQSGFVTLGEFRCFAGAFIEVPTCVPAGTSVASYPAVHISFRMHSSLASTIDADAYLGEIASPMRSMMANSLSPYSLAPNDITFRIRHLTPDEVHSLTSSTSGARRLAILSVEVSATVAIISGQASDAQLVVSRLAALTTSNQLVQTFNSIYSAQCGQSCLAGPAEFLVASEPQTTRTFRGPPTTTSTTSIATFTAGTASSLVASQQDETNGSVVIVVSLTLTIAVSLLCVLLVLGAWWLRGKRKLLSYVKPFHDDCDVASLRKDLPLESTSRAPNNWIDDETTLCDLECSGKLSRRELAEKKKADKAVAKIAKQQEKQAKLEAAEAKKQEKAAAKLAKEQERKELALKVEAEKAAAKIAKEQDKQAKLEAAEASKIEKAAAKLAKEQETKEIALKVEAEKAAAKLLEEEEREVQKASADKLKAEQLLAKIALEEECRTKREADARLKEEERRAAKLAKELEKEAKRDAAAQLKADKLAEKAAAQAEARAKKEAADKLKQEEREAAENLKQEAREAAKRAKEDELQAKKEKEKEALREKTLQDKKAADEKLKVERDAVGNCAPGAPEFDMMEMDDALVDWRDPF